MIFVNDPVFSVVFTAVAPGLVYAGRSLFTVKYRLLPSADYISL